MDIALEHGQIPSHSEDMVCVHLLRVALNTHSVGQCRSGAVDKCLDGDNNKLSSRLCVSSGNRTENRTEDDRSSLVDDFAIKYSPKEKNSVRFTRAHLEYLFVY